jgi:hypothetical protein
MANPMSHVAKSRILEEIIIELRKKGLEIPANVMSDLKSARTLMKVENVNHKGPVESEPQIDQYLSSAEAYVITEAANLFPNEKVQKWLAELDVASCDSCVTVEKAKEESKFIPGVPRDQKWVRVEPQPNQPIEMLKQMATETDLTFHPDKDGHLIVYGKEKDVKLFIKKMTQNGKTL